jgi:GNAT superfamily N-acetyltransferase
MLTTSEHCNTPRSTGINGLSTLNSLLLKHVSIRQATIADTWAISTVLIEAAQWLREQNIPVWSPAMFSIAKVKNDISEHRYYVAEDGGSVVGTFRFQLTDREVWPEVPDLDSAFIHRLAVLRSHAGCGVAQQMILYAKQLTQQAERQFLRLDCAADQPKLRKIYEDADFVWCDDIHVGPHLVARYEWENR